MLELAGHGWSLRVQANYSLNVASVNLLGPCTKWPFFCGGGGLISGGENE